MYCLERSVFLWPLCAVGKWGEQHWTIECYDRMLKGVAERTALSGQFSMAAERSGKVGRNNTELLNTMTRPEKSLQFN